MRTALISLLSFVLFFAVATAPPVGPGGDKTDDKQAVPPAPGTDEDDPPPKLSSVTARHLLDAIGDCKRKVHSDHVYDLLCQDTSKADADTGKFCETVRQLKKEEKPLDAVPGAEKYTEHKSVTKMAHTIKFGYKENYKCKWAARKWAAFRRAIKWSKGEYDEAWMTDCLRPKFRELVADKPELADIYAKESEESTEALRSMIRAVNCPTDRINLDSPEPFEELKKLPITLRQQFTQVLPKIRDYLGCFWDTYHEPGATFRLVFACEDDQRFYQKATKCTAGKKMDPGFEIDFPPTLRDYYLKRNGEQAEVKVAEDSKKKTVYEKVKEVVKGVGSSIAGWTHRRMCGMAGMLDELSVKSAKLKADIKDLKGKKPVDPKDAKFPAEELPEARRRKRALSQTAVGFTIIFFVAAGIAAGGATGAITHCGLSGHAPAVAGGYLGGFIGMCSGVIGFFIAVGVLNLTKKTLQSLGWSKGKA